MTSTNSQCKTCNMTEEITEYLTELHKQGVGFKALSGMLERDHGIHIADTSLGNHFKKHEKSAAGVVSVRIPKENQPKVEIKEDGTGTVVSKPQDGAKVITDFSDILREMGVDPETFQVVGSAGISKWMTPAGDWLTSYRVRIEKISEEESEKDLDDILDLIKDVKPSPNNKLNGDHTFVFAAGDLQLGKSDGDGTEGIVRRYRESLQKAVDKATELSDTYGPILISWVGDCIEGMVSQGGRNARRTHLTTTQQVKLLRRLMTETIKAFAPLTDDLQVVSVPGNHDEAQREPVTTDYSDSWAVDALAAVSEALEFNPEAFGHVKVHLVPYDELTLTVTSSGSTITHAHGHQWNRGKHFEWWSGQHWGDHEPGKADILICGHYHTGAVEQENFKHMVRTPSFEQESTYFRHRTGKVGNPSAVTFLTKDGTLKYIDFE